jgi:hypothetical protein
MASSPSAKIGPGGSPLRPRCDHKARGVWDSRGQGTQAHPSHPPACLNVLLLLLLLPEFDVMSIAEGLGIVQTPSPAALLLPLSPQRGRFASGGHGAADARASAASPSPSSGSGTLGVTLAALYAFSESLPARSVGWEDLTTRDVVRRYVVAATSAAKCSYSSMISDKSVGEPSECARPPLAHLKGRRSRGHSHRERV